MIIEGLLLGLSLSFMIGPLLFSIMEGSLEKGFRAGFAVAAGIWVSDLIYMSLVLSGMQALSMLTALPGFRLWAGILGGCILVLFGVGSLMARRSSRKFAEAPDKKKKERSSFQYWLKGFLLNTINPFTVFFWISIAGAVIVPNNWNTIETLYFLGAMLGTLVVTDTLKAYGAKLLRRFLTPEHTQLIQKGIGAALITFGIVLIIRVI